MFLALQDAAVQPSLVIVYFGGNDSMGAHSSGLGPHVPLPEYIENMRKVALHLKVAYPVILEQEYDFIIIHKNIHTFSFRFHLVKKLCKLTVI